MWWTGVNIKTKGKRERSRQMCCFVVVLYWTVIEVNREMKNQALSKSQVFRSYEKKIVKNCPWVLRYFQSINQNRNCVFMQQRQFRIQCYVTPQNNKPLGEITFRTLAPLVAVSYPQMYNVRYQSMLLISPQKPARSVATKFTRIDRLLNPSLRQWLSSRSFSIATSDIQVEPNKLWIFPHAEVLCIEVKL